MIRAERLTKRFRVYAHPRDRFKEVLCLGLRSYHSHYTAVREIDLEVRKGETLGIIGQNGSGKSTLLKILARLMLPTEGAVETKGRVSAIIELGTGFHPEFSGRSNVYLTASLMGLGKQEIERILPEVIEFSELAPFIDRPVKTYSSGMWVRLAFSVAVAVKPEVLLIDEALSVGDMLFQQRCVSKLRDFQAAGTSIVFVSHDLVAVKTLCDKAILMDRGAKVAEGSPEAVCGEYGSLITSRAAQGSFSKEIRGHHRRFGSREAIIESVVMRDPRGQLRETVVSGEAAVIEVTVRRLAPLADPSVGILLRDRLGIDVFGTNTKLAGVTIPDRWERWTVRFELDLSLGPRSYFITAAVHSGRDHLETCYDWIDNAMAFEVVPGSREFAGYSDLRPKVSAEAGESAP